MTDKTTDETTDNTTVYTVEIRITMAPDDGYLPDRKWIEREIGAVLRRVQGWPELRDADYELMDRSPAAPPVCPDCGRLTNSPPGFLCAICAA